MRRIQLGLIDTGSSTHSLLVLLSVVEMSLRTQTALETAKGALAAIISTHFVHHIIIVTFCIIVVEGGVYFAQSCRFCG